MPEISDFAHNLITQHWNLCAWLTDDYKTAFIELVDHVKYNDARTSAEPFPTSIYASWVEGEDLFDPPEEWRALGLTLDFFPWPSLTPLLAKTYIRCCALHWCVVHYLEIHRNRALLFTPSGLSKLLNLGLLTYGDILSLSYIDHVANLDNTLHSDYTGTT